MAHAKNLGEPFMAHPDNLYNILCKYRVILLSITLYAYFFNLHRVRTGL